MIEIEANDDLTTAKVTSKETQGSVEANNNPLEALVLQSYDYAQEAQKQAKNASEKVEELKQMALDNIADLETKKEEFLQDIDNIKDEVANSIYTAGAAQIQIIEEKLDEIHALDPVDRNLANISEDGLNVIRNAAAEMLNNPFFFGMSQYFEVEPNNLSWLKSEGQWNAKAVYPDFYNWLLESYNNAEKIKVPVTLPVFTSNTTNGFTITTSNGAADSYTLINGVSLSYNTGQWSSYWYQIETPQAYCISSYSITADSNVNAEYPSAWILKGSNDNENWADIDSQEDIIFSLGQTRDFAVNENNKYKYFRLVFSAGIESGGNGELKQIGFSFLEEKIEKFVLSTNEYTDYDFVINTENETFRLPLKNGNEYTIDFLQSIPKNFSATLPFIATYKCFVTGISVTPGVTETSVLLNGKLIAKEYGDYCNFQQPMNIGDELTTTSSSIESISVFPYIGNGTLYYYIGETVQNANLIDAGRLSEQLAGKLDKNNVAAYISESYQNGDSGYIEYSDKTLIQWSSSIETRDTTIQLLKPYADTKYAILGVGFVIYGIGRQSVGSKTVSSFSTSSELHTCATSSWMTIGKGE